ncbi:MAG: hypothetical protein Q9218_006890, partial [Villophora microphyllina]
MPHRKAPKTWAEEIADLDDPAPRDLDPEHLGDGNSSDSGSEGGSDQAKEHYIDVGSSKLRKPNTPTLGPEYSGSRISRDDAFGAFHDDEDDDDPFASAQSDQDSFGKGSEEDDFADPDHIELNLDKTNAQDGEIDSSEAFGSDDSEKYKDYIFRGSKTGDDNARLKAESKGYVAAPQPDDDGDGFSDMESEKESPVNATANVTGLDEHRSSETEPESGQDLDDSKDVEMEDQDSGSQDSQSDASDSNTDQSSIPPPANDDRAALRKMMTESQKVITSNLSKAAKSDIAKGRAIRKQRTVFDSLLNTRIRLQKALVAANSLPPPNTSASLSLIHDPAIEAAEKAALRLWSTLDSLRQPIVPTSSTPASKPPQPGPNTPLSSLWTHMQHQETQSHTHRLKTLNKWSQKTAPLSSLPPSNKFSQATTQKPLSTVLEQQLSSSTNMEKLIAKT